MNALDDATLLERYAKAGSDDAFRMLVDRYASMVYSICAGELRNADLAQDATQAVFVVLAQRAARLRVDRSLAGWLYATSRTISRSLSRKERRRLSNEAMLDPDRSTDTAIATTLRIHVWAAIDKLREQDREAIILRYWQGMSLAEVGEAQGASEGAARMRIDRALRRMRHVLARGDVSAEPQDIFSQILLPVPRTLLQALHAFRPETAPLHILLISKGVHSTMSTVLKFSLAGCLATASIAGVLGLARGSAVHREPRVAATTGRGSGRTLLAGNKCLLRPRYFKGQTLRYAVSMTNLDEGGVKFHVLLKVLSIENGMANIVVSSTMDPGPGASADMKPQEAKSQLDVHSPLSIGVTGAPEIKLPDRPVDVGQKWAVRAPGAPTKTNAWITFQGLKDVHGIKLAELGLSVKWPGDPGGGTGKMLLDSDNQIVSFDWAMNALPSTLAALGVTVQSDKHKVVRTVCHLERESAL